MIITRRRFMQSTAALFCAPAFIEYKHLMKVVAPKPFSQSFTISGMTKADTIAVYLPRADGLYDREAIASGGDKYGVIQYTSDQVFYVCQKRIEFPTIIKPWRGSVYVPATGDKYAYI